MRAFIVGNGSLVVVGGPGGTLQALYAPDLAPEHQRLRRPARLGLWIDGALHWLPDHFRATAPSDRASAIAEQSLRSDEIDLDVWIEAFAAAEPSLVVRRIEVANRSDRAREARLLLHHDFRLSHAGTTEAARRDDHTGGIVHHAGARWALVNVLGPDGAGIPLARLLSRPAPDAPGAERAASAAAGPIGGAVTGIVDSLAYVPLHLPPRGSALVTTWIAVGRSLAAVRAADESFRRDGVAAALGKARARWNLWLAEGRHDFVDLSEDAVALFDQGLLTLRLHQAPNGAIFSGLARETGGADRLICSLREAGVAADALGRAGHGSAARRYFTFVSDSCREWGEPAAALDVSGAPAAIQEGVEGLGVHLWALARHFERERDVELLESQMAEVVGPFADHIVGSLDFTLRLPGGSDGGGASATYPVTSASSVRGGLRGAARLAALLGRGASARGWLAAADEVARAMATRFYRPDLGRFARALVRDGSGTRPDVEMDESLLAVGLFDDFEPEDPRVRATVDAARAALWVRSGAGGLARRARDEGADSGMGDGPRSAWTPSTLRLACHLVRTAARAQDLDDARALFLWCAARAEGRSWLPEWVPGIEGESVPSLATHAWLVTALLDYAERSRVLRRCERCGAPAPARREKRVTPGSRSLPRFVAHL